MLVSMSLDGKINKSGESRVIDFIRSRLNEVADSQKGAT